MSLDHEEKQFLKDMAQESPAPKARSREAVQPAGDVEASIDEDALRGLASSACQSALCDGINEEAFARLARTVAQRATVRITRLQAEIADLIEARDNRVTERLAALDALTVEREALKAEVRRLKEEKVEAIRLKSEEWLRANNLQSELTKVREHSKELSAMLLKVRDSEVHEGRLLYDSITRLITPQSAPAAKTTE